MLAVLVVMLVSGRLPLHATLWQFCVFWLPWMALNLAASSALCRGQAGLWDGAYTNLLTTEIFVRATFVLVHPFRAAFRVTPKDGIDDGGWAAARQLRMVLVMAGVLVAAVAVRCLSLGGVLHLPPLHGLAVVAGLGFAAWELVLVMAALWRVTRRHQYRHHYRVPVDVAAILDDTVIRVVDLTPGGAGVLSPRPLAVGEEVELHLLLSTLEDDLRDVRVRFSICSCRPVDDVGWRMGGTITPRTEADGEALIEHCHLVTTRARLTAAGRLTPSAETGQPVGATTTPAATRMAAGA
jgi:hypothetical protein